MDMLASVCAVAFQAADTGDTQAREFLAGVFSPDALRRLRRQRLINW